MKLYLCVHWYEMVEMCCIERTNTVFDSSSTVLSQVSVKNMSCHFKGWFPLTQVWRICEQLWWMRRNSLQYPIVGLQMR